MGHHELCAGRRRPLEELPMSGHPRGHQLYLLGTGDLKAVGAVVVEGLRLEELVQVVEDLPERGDAGTIETLVLWVRGRYDALARRGTRYHKVWGGVGEA